MEMAVCGMHSYDQDLAPQTQDLCTAGCAHVEIWGQGVRSSRYRAGNHVPGLQLVSKHWKETIESSTAIQHYYQNYALIPVRLEGADSNIPVYEKSSNIKPHPALRNFVEDYSISPCTVLRTLTLSRSTLHSPPVMDANAEVTTIPPCQ